MSMSMNPRGADTDRVIDRVGTRRDRLRRRRAIKDGLSRYGVGAGGIGVIVALGLIFVYLFYETYPMLKPVRMELGPVYTLSAENDGVETLHYSLDRFEEIGTRFLSDGRIDFFESRTGSALGALQVPVPEGASVTAFGRAENRRRLFAYAFTDGSVLPVKVEYPQTFVAGVRQVGFELSWPLGDDAVRLGRGDQIFTSLAVVEGRGGYILAAGTEDGVIELALYTTRSNLMTGEVQIRRSDYQLPSIGRPIERILINETLRNVFVIDDRGHLFLFDIVDRDNPRLLNEVILVDQGARVTAAEFLVGSRSLIVGGSDGTVRQWFLVRDEQSNEPRLTLIRALRSHEAPVRFIDPEYIRKGFITGDDNGVMGLHYATSSVTLAMKPVTEGAISRLAIGPNNQLALVQTLGSDRLQTVVIDNPHPQTTLTGLWGRVWYEGRDLPEFIWQSSSADDAFEAKFSIVPLTIGTLKAALFAMLLAMPLAIMGAIYTAYFMAPRFRRVVKPSIELMEALPTVILGFLAGIWLAPYVENNLPILVTGVLLIPAAILASGYLWSRLPQRLRQMVPAGWEAVLLIPVVLASGWLVVTSSPWIEVSFFEGSMRQWLSDVGIPYDQRNALIVGLAMGFAVIPTIFSIAEDAVFNVPRHLTQGSLALGATPWQTVIGVVLLTASPGIFSAVMIGFGRAVGETMIVLMASGNSPVLNFNLFEGMRTLAANIAVELPETDVGSTHFRVLFLSALVLLVFTFVLNTVAEIVRQRLRKRYASL
jgi:phosphate transport system permease protein